MRQSGAVSYRQVWVGICFAALAPAATLPSVVARQGNWGWLGVALVIPVAPIYLRLLQGLGSGGLGAALRERWGWLGRCVLAVYYLWAMALAALTAGGCVDRLGRTDYGEVPNWLAALLLGAVTAYLIYRGWEPFLRAVQIFFLALVAILALFFVLGAANLNGKNLRPEAWSDVWRGLGGLWPAAATVSVGAMGAFIPHEQRKKGEWAGWRWLALWGLAAGGLCALVIGTLGAELTTKAPLPFFLALQGIGFPGGFQRLEAAGTAAWVLSDLALIGLAALAGKQITGAKGKRGMKGGWPILAAAVLGGLFLPNQTVAGAQDALFLVNGALGIVIPVLVALTKPPLVVRGAKGSGYCGQKGK